MSGWREELGAWGPLMEPTLAQDWCRRLEEQVEAAYAGPRPVYPPRRELFTALRLTPPDRVRCVILGQDPYPGAGQAHGLAFSVKPGVALPRSLGNIYRELEADLSIPPAASGTLTRWAEQGVLLLNDTLTVYGGDSNSHARWGWDRFTTRLLLLLREQPRPIAFVLWGNHAKKKGSSANITDSPFPRLVLSAPHPSPLSARRGFFGSRPFSQVNAFLAANAGAPIDWRVEL